MSQAKNSGDVGSTTDRLASMAHETIDGITPAGNRAEDEIRGAATRVVDRAKRLHDHGVEAAEDRIGAMRSYAESNALAIAGIAFAAGVFLTAWLRR
jgi:hypothetical protein